MASGHDDWWWNSRAAENSEYEINFAGYSFSSYWSSPPPQASTSQGFFSWPERNLSHSQSLAESEASDGSSSTANCKKRTPWTSTEEEILISLCQERGSELKGSGSSQKWKEIADQLNTLSEEVNTSSTIKTGTQCKDKWPNLLTAYKKAKVLSTKSGNGTEKMKAFKHFDQMDKFMSERHEIVMLFVRNSSNSSSQISAAVEDSALSSQEHFRVQAQETEGQQNLSREKARAEK